MKRATDETDEMSMGEMLATIAKVLLVGYLVSRKRKQQNPRYEKSKKNQKQVRRFQVEAEDIPFEEIR